MQSSSAPRSICRLIGSAALAVTFVESERISSACVVMAPNCVRQKFPLSGKADYLIAGYFAGLAEASKAGVKDQVEPLSPTILEAEMFVAFSKKSRCRSLAPKFSEGITAMTTDGRFDKILEDATTAWDAAQQAKK